MERKYLEVSLKELLQIVFAKWWIIFLFGVISGGAAYYVSSEFIEPVYESSAFLFIGKEESGLGLSLTELQVSSQLIKDYQQIAQTRHVIEKVISSLNLDITVKNFRDSLGINVLEESRLFVVSFKHSDPVIARDVANELAIQLSLTVGQVVEVENIQIIDMAILADYPLSPNVIKNTIFMGLLGGFVGLFLVFILEMFNNSYKSDEEVEKDLGIPIIGVIPEFKGVKR